MLLYLPLPTVEHSRHDGAHYPDSHAPDSGGYYEAPALPQIQKVGCSLGGESRLEEHFAPQNLKVEHLLPPVLDVVVVVVQRAILLLGEPCKVGQELDIPHMKRNAFVNALDLDQTCGILSKCCSKSRVG